MLAYCNLVAFSCIHIPSLSNIIFLSSIYCPHLKLSSEETLLQSINLMVVSIPELRCAQGLNLWRNYSIDVNDEIFKGYRKGNPEGKINEIAAGCSTSLSLIYNNAHEISDSSCLLSCCLSIRSFEHG